MRKALVTFSKEEVVAVWEIFVLQQRVFTQYEIYFKMVNIL